MWFCTGQFSWAGSSLSRFLYPDSSSLNSATGKCGWDLLRWKWRGSHYTLVIVGLRWWGTVAKVMVGKSSSFPNIPRGQEPQNLISQDGFGSWIEYENWSGLHRVLTLGGDNWIFPTQTTQTEIVGEMRLVKGNANSITRRGKYMLNKQTGPFLIFPAPCLVLCLNWWPCWPKVTTGQSYQI